MTGFRSRQRLRLSLGPHEVDIITSALMYYIDTYVDTDEDVQPWQQQDLRQAKKAWGHIVREKVRQGFRS